MDLPHELAHRHQLRRLVLARLSRPDDPADLANLDLELAALAATAFLADPSDPQASQHLAQAHHAFAEAAACATTTTLSHLAAHPPEADVILQGPDDLHRRVPHGATPLHPSLWLRSLAAALIVRDLDAVMVLVHPDHLDHVRFPPGMGDPFWTPLCRAMATVVCGVPPPDRSLDALAALMAPDQLTSASPEVVRTSLLPLLAILHAFHSGQDLDAALQRALHLHQAPRTTPVPPQPPAPDHPSHLLPIEVFGLAALAHDRGHPVSSHGFPEPLLRGLHPRPEFTVTLAYRLRRATRHEDPTGFLDLRDHPRAGRTHHLLHRDGVLVAHYLACGRDGVPRATAEFLLPDPPHLPDSPPPLALDPGERLLLAERYAHRAGDAAQAGHPSEARTWLSLAIEAVDSVLSDLPPDTDAVPAAALTNPRGQHLFETEPGRFRRDRLLAYRQALQHSDVTHPAAPSNPPPSPTPSTVSPITAPSLPPDPAAAIAAVQRSIENIRSALRPLLETLPVDRSGETVQRLRPHADDYPRVFVPEAISVARAGFEAFWSAPLKIESPPGSHLDPEFAVAPAGVFALHPPHPLAQPFPQAYQAIASFLNPHRTWVAWRYVRPGHDRGMAFDGLVWCDDHWAWFPKPYRVLAALIPTPPTSRAAR